VVLVLLLQVLSNQELTVVQMQSHWVLRQQVVCL
jgi:hypothetical protein